MKCRHCAFELDLDLIDLGTSPPSNAYLTPSQLAGPEKYFPLRVRVCSRCWLAQTEDYNAAEELFDADYAYFSAFSTSWLLHCERFAEDICHRLALDKQSLVLEIAANDGYLLQYFVARGIPCYGVEPTASTAAVARSRGIEIVSDFFGTKLARSLRRNRRPADLIVANNVLAHVPDINDFVAGVSMLLKPHGVATFEFPHLMQLIDHTQFDTIYHEHFSYLSLTTVEEIFARSGLSIFDVEQHPTHGGSLRVFTQASNSGRRPVSPHVEDLRAVERDRGIETRGYYQALQANAERIKNDLLEFLIKAKRRNELVVAYGAAAKGNTLLNFAGIRSDLIAFVADRNPAKQGKFLPGSRIPVYDESALVQQRPRWILVLPWNLEAEIVSQLAYVKEWGCEFVVATPRLRVVGADTGK